MKVADGVDDYPFAIVTDSAVAKENKVDGDAVVVFKKVCMTSFRALIRLMTDTNYITIMFSLLF